MTALETALEEKKNVEEFLKGYQELCEKHRLFVSSCGCCHSPFLIRAELSDPIRTLPAHIQHLRRVGLNGDQG